MDSNPNRSLFAHLNIAKLFLIGQYVDTSATSYIFCLLMEISYVVLFGNFFYHAYIKGGGKKFQKEKKPVASANGHAASNGLKSE